jgi:hypothetical protein
MHPKFSRKLTRIQTPFQVQQFISKIPYNPDDDCRSAERVFLERKAHCFEGALLAAVMLEKLGHEPQLLHFRSHRDDDHVVAIFKIKGKWGAVGKSNTTLLGFRNPVYRNLESLALSYFPFYFNVKGELSLLSWARIRLNRYEKKWQWRAGANDVSDLSPEFYAAKGNSVYSVKQIEKLAKAPPLVVEACFLGANQSGLYRP